MTKEEKSTFKELFGKYCRQEVDKGHCEADTCEWCPINKAYNEIFDDFNDEEEQE